MLRRITPRIDARVAGGLLCGVALWLLWFPSLLTSALGIELLAAAFFCWARAAKDSAAQVPRWAWLRRPAVALWLAVAIQTLSVTLEPGSEASNMGRTLEVLRRLEAIAIVWAGLELLAALPLTRPYSDLPGPFLAVRPWLPILLPAAGFVLLWRQAPHWITVAEVRHGAALLLLVTAVLGAIRSFSRRQWIASLRWIAVTDSAMAALLVSSGLVPEMSSFLLWLGACGCHAFMLAGELRGASPRRGQLLTRLWRTASWMAIAALSWTVLMTSGAGVHGRLEPVFVLGISLTAVLTAWITVGRMVNAPERRSLVRRDQAINLSHVVATAIMALGPIAILMAWWSGFEPSWGRSLLALLPAGLGGLAAVATRQGHGRALWSRLQGWEALMRRGARALFRMVVGIERLLVTALGRATAALSGPLHDLHTGDAQEYLLFVIGLGVLAVVLPLLQ